MSKKIYYKSPTSLFLTDRKLTPYSWVVPKLNACKAGIGKRMELRPHIVHWLYKLVIGPILYYGDTV